MAIDRIIELLRDSVAGNQAAFAELLASYQTNSISQAGSEQIHLYLKAFSGKTPQAIYLRAFLYDYGYGVRVDFAMAFLLMREAAAKGHSLAIYEVGHRFLEGRGVEQNYQNALQWLELAAGSPHYIKLAMLDLSTMYERGWGVEVNIEKSKEWREKGEKS